MTVDTVDQLYMYFIVTLMVLAPYWSVSTCSIFSAVCMGPSKRSRLVRQSATDKEEGESYLICV